MFKKSFKVVIIKAKMYVKKLKSLQSESSSCEAVDGRNPNSHQSAWQVLKSAFLFPVFWKSFVRHFSLLGEEKVSSLRGWGDVPMRDFWNSLGLN